MALKSFLIVAALSAAALAKPALASNKYTIDPEHVTVVFTIQHMKWAKYQGVVRTIAGNIVFDREHIESSSVEVKMDAKSVDTLNVARDYELQGYGLLEAAQNPQITFTSTTVEKTGEKTGIIVGDLTMAGVTHPVTLNVIFDGEGVSSWDKLQRIGFSATGTLDTTDFGMKNLITLGIGPKLDFAIEVEATTY